MIPLVKVFMSPRAALMPRLEEVLYSGMIAEGETVYRFENEFKEKFKQNTVLAISSGTAALHAALALAGVGAGDEVISTPMTAEPTNVSILYRNAKVVWADVDPESGNMDPVSVREKITPRTKAILCVHYAGYPARLQELKEIADEYGVALIEDCAHALGSKYNDRHVGVIGNYSIFSFQAIKHMTTVDGGMLGLADDSQLIQAKKFRWFGMLKGAPRTELNVDSVGYKYNMSNVTAAIGLVQLEHIDSILQSHINNGRYYDEALATMSGVEFAKCDENAKPSYWLYTLLSDSSDDIEKLLNSNGIMASKLHRPNHLHTLFAESKAELPGLDKFYKRMLHIPCGWWLGEEDREKILTLIKKG